MSYDLPTKFRGTLKGAFENVYAADVRFPMNIFLALTSQDVARMGPGGTATHVADRDFKHNRLGSMYSVLVKMKTVQFDTSSKPRLDG